MQGVGDYLFREMDEASAREIATWHYDPPYEMYNCLPDEVEAHVKALLKPEYRYHTVWDSAGELIAFRCFGADARVPGGDYSADALDMGGGLRPDLTGRGLGISIIEAALEFARRNFAPRAFRVTVAAFNERALRVCEKVGYRPVDSFHHPRSGERFIILVLLDSTGCSTTAPH